MNKPADGNPTPPSGCLQIRLLFKLRYIAEAEIGKNRHRFRHADHALQFLVIDNTNPADTDALGSGGQPKILNGATGAVQICCAHRRAAKYR